MSLFRSEAVEAQRKRLYGHVTIHQPASLMLMTAVAAGVTAMAAVFVVTGSISRKEVVSGWIIPEKGLAQVYASKGGVAQRILVNVGDVVKADQPLAVLSQDVSTNYGGLAVQERAMTQQRLAEVDGQIGDSELKSRMEATRLLAHARALRAEASHLLTEAKLVDQQLQISRRQLSDIQPLVAKGFIAVVEKDRREQTVFSTERTLADLNLQIDAKKSEAVDTETQAKAIPTAAALAASELRGQRAALQQSMAELETKDALILQAPIAGKVAAINIHPGDAVSAAGPALSIAPSDGIVVAELLATSKAVGFIAPGQKVRLMIDAFPSERFGEVEATINTVSHATVIASQVGIPLDVKDPVYRIIAKVSTAYVSAYGHQQPLQPGMTFKASVVTAKRTFLQWFLDPLLAAGRNAR